VQVRVMQAANSRGPTVLHVRTDIPHTLKSASARRRSAMIVIEDLSWAALDYTEAIRLPVWVLE
jgi:hypothetical protein